MKTNITIGAVFAALVALSAVWPPLKAMAGDTLEIMRAGDSIREIRQQLEAQEKQRQIDAQRVSEIKAAQEQVQQTQRQIQQQIQQQSISTGNQLDVLLKAVLQIQ